MNATQPPPSCNIRLNSAEVALVLLALQHDIQRAQGRASDERLSDACRKSDEEKARQMMPVARRMRMALEGLR